MDISGNDINELHQENIQFISFTFSVFHLDISGNDINELHPENIQLKFISLVNIRSVIRILSSEKILLLSEFLFDFLIPDIFLIELL